MKIKSFRVLNYKNLKDCRIDFAKCGGVVVVAGVNGSGKSNFLEAMSLALLHVKSSGSVRLGNIPAYEIEYEISAQNVSAKWRGRGQEIEWSGSWSGAQPPTPSKVMAMYSGEFSRLANCGFNDSLGFWGRESMLLSASDLPNALLYFALKNNGDLSGLLGLKAAVQENLFVSYRIQNAEAFQGEEQPDEFGTVLMALAEGRFSPDEEHEMPIRDFINAFNGVVDIEIAGADLTVDNLTQSADGYQPYLTDVVFRVSNDNGQTFSQNDLSEGEKRLIMIDYIYDGLVDDKSVVLLDEPDAHVHESKKLELFDRIASSVDFGCTTVMTTHSVALIEHVPACNLVCFEISQGNIQVRQDVDFDILANLTDSRLSFFSTLPIMLFEGKSDIYLLLNAMSAMQRFVPTKYANVSLARKFDFYILGGSGNASDGLDLFRAKFPSRKIIVVLDGDNAGRKTLKSIMEARGLTNSSTIRQPDGSEILNIDANTKVVTPPHPTQVNGDFGIEDYLDKSYLNRRVNGYLQSPTYKSFMSMPNIKHDLKEELGNKRIVPSPPDSVFSGYQVIIDFLLQQ